MTERVHTAETAGVILAAGGSSRLGRPKQLLAFEGQSLLRRACRNALEAGLAPVLAVIGANAPLMREEIADLPVVAVENIEWRHGPGTSIRAAMAMLPSDWPNTPGAIIALCDQPLILPAHLRKLIALHNDEEKGIVACGYLGTIGPPAYFSNQYYNNLTTLPDTQGAKSVIYANAEDAAIYPCPDAAIDIDTLADYQSLLKS